MAHTPVGITANMLGQTSVIANNTNSTKPTANSCCHRNTLVFDTLIRSFRYIKEARTGSVHAFKDLTETSPFYHFMSSSWRGSQNPYDRLVPLWRGSHLPKLRTWAQLQDKHAALSQVRVLQICNTPIYAQSFQLPIRSCASLSSLVLYSSPWYAKPKEAAQLP